MRSNNVSLPPLVVILGPTAVGKTELSIRLAERLDGEVVSADSRLFYRGMDIGTAKPSCEERLRVPHHLIDVARPDEVWSLARFQEAARDTIAGIHSRGRLPFLVGGTGQYIRAVVEGWEGPRVAPDPRLRSILESWAKEIGPDELHRRLKRLDPVAAENMDDRNVRRTVRALEVILSSGQPFSSQRQSGSPLYRLLQLGLFRPRPELYERLDVRIDAMLAAGFEHEVEALLDHGLSPDLPSFSAIGYRDIAACIQGRLSREEAVAQIKRKTRIFVRRQANWFKRTDPQIHWFLAGADILDDMEKSVRKFLQAN